LAGPGLPDYIRLKSPTVPETTSHVVAGSAQLSVRYRLVLWNCFKGFPETQTRVLEKCL